MIMRPSNHLRLWRGDTFWEGEARRRVNDHRDHRDHHYSSPVIIISNTRENFPRVFLFISCLILVATAEASTINSHSSQSFSAKCLLIFNQLYDPCNHKWRTFSPSPPVIIVITTAPLLNPLFPQAKYEVSVTNELAIVSRFNHNNLIRVKKTLSPANLSPEKMCDSNTDIIIMIPISGFHGDDDDKTSSTFSLLSKTYTSKKYEKIA